MASILCPFIHRCALQVDVQLERVAVPPAETLNVLIIAAAAFGIFGGPVHRGTTPAKTVRSNEMLGDADRDQDVLKVTRDLRARENRSILKAKNWGFWVRWRASLPENAEVE